jgi:hypothetical protein
MFVRGLCMGFAFVPMQAASYATIDPIDNGRASSIFATQRQVGISLGVAVLSSILVTFMRIDAPPTTAAAVARSLHGYHLAFGAAVGFAWIGALAALFVDDEDAAATMKARTKVSVE